MRLIDADELGEVVDSHGNVHWEDIEKAPTVDAVPRSVLEDIKAEIEALETYEYDDFIRMRAVLDIIDKHISGKENE